MPAHAASNFIEVGVAGRPIEGEAESGDAYVVQPFDDGVLIAVIDGLGHGHRAAEASHAAAVALRELAGAPVLEILRTCHDRLRGTRGVVLSIASMLASESSMTWTGLGNVEGILCRASGSEREGLLVRGGVLGDRLPLLRASTLALARGDVLVFATDGIRPGFSASVELAQPAQSIADLICARFARDEDDALVLAARWLGRAA